MEKAKVIGPNGLAPVSLQRQADIRITTEVIYDVITNSNMISLEESAHAPAAVRNKARADRLAGVKTVSARLNGRRFTQVNVNDEPRKLCDASKDIKKAMKLAKDKQAAASRATAPRASVALKNSGIDPRAEPFVPAGPKDEVAYAHAPLKSAPYKAAPVKAAGESKDADNESAAGSKKAGSTGGEDSAAPPKRPRGITAPADFMKQVRLLHLQKQMASKAVPAGPPRRIVFGNLPEWADISSVLQLVYGGAIERAWSENGEVIVQFVEQDVCVKYFEDHCEGINLKDGDNDITISVVMPEEGLQDNAELWKRVQEGASRVVSLSGLPTGFKTTDNENVLGIAAGPDWGGKSFERILIKQAESGVNVYVSFYDLHDGWNFLQSIKEGAYDCIAGFEVDPCALAPGFHFMDEPNLMFSGILALGE